MMARQRTKQSAAGQIYLTSSYFFDMRCTRNYPHVLQILPSPTLLSMVELPFLLSPGTQYIQEYGVVPVRTSKMLLSLVL
jgi:hypothetical protein